MGKKSWRETFVTTSVKFRCEISLMVKTWIWSFWSAIMGQIFKILTWRDFGPLRQRSKSFPPGFLTHFGHPIVENYESVFLTGVRPESGIEHFEVWPDWLNFQIFHLEGVFWVSLQHFPPILAALLPKIMIRYFRHKNGYKIVARNFSHHWCQVPKCQDGTLHPKCRGGTLQPKCG